MKLQQEKLNDITAKLINWIKNIMQINGGSKAVIGISGGKDSSVTAALCVEALGNKNVYGVLMPDGIQKDIGYAYEICTHLDIPHAVMQINPVTEAFFSALEGLRGHLIPSVSDKTKINLPPRVRMTALYAISQSIPGSRVLNTSNLSEDWIGYTTLYGDTAGALSPLAMLTSDEVIQVGRKLGVPEKFLIKPPEDGLTGKTDEEVLGFTYDTLNRYIREGIIEDTKLKEKIDLLHKYNRFKFTPIPMFPANLPIKAEDTTGIYEQDGKCS
ncbi:NAD(+) synthase [Dethiobacter alkaliphilus]|uniref:NH(3)-dependent NAD(+) synthetase n=1 Tax=Dethiobacter alkaliphilus AHT 1 TaxID=555088 RepID=C0GCG2_DETAL|nr:NAD(+) synthase [Dethiobacter alkaliphilus]EEG78897.1 NAD+ synthetase [Dethiobacter alkaliphilus AHT 1]